MRTALGLLTAAGTLLLVRLLADNNPARHPWSRLFLLGLALTLVLYALTGASFLLYARWKKAIQNLWLVLASCAVALLLPDLALNRLLDRHKYVRVVPDEIVHHRLKRGAESEMRSPDFRATARVNRYGLRGAEPETPRSADGYRLLVTGDSFTMGEGVDDDQAYPVLLGAALSKRLATRVEVLNAGVDSYAPALCYLDLERNLPLLRPDAVLLAFDMSDLLQEQYYRSLARFGPDGDLLAVPSPHGRGNLADGLMDWVSRNLYLVRAFVLGLRDRLGDEDPDSMEAVIGRVNDRLLLHTLKGDPMDRDRQWADVFDSLTRIQDLCRRQGVQFALTVYPWGHQVNDREWVPGRTYWMPEGAEPSDASVERIRGFCREHDLQLIDTFPAFRAYRGTEPLYFRHDMHWTPAGHRLMSDALAGPLIELVRQDLERRRSRADTAA